MNVLNPHPRASRPEQRLCWVVFGGVFAITLLFAAFTRHAWEDYYITYRVSKNLATGHGLVYTAGEKVHTFTSPLNVLIPAGLNVVTGNHSDELVLWLFRVLSAALLAGAAVLLFDSARKNSLSRLAIALMVGMFALDAKTVDFSINGQEVAFMMFFLALLLHTLTVRSEWTMLKLALAGAGLMWTRPDGFIYFGVVVLGFLVFDAGRPIGKSRMELVKTILVAGAITTVLYLPWLLWAWHYFGSPIPHTIIAKGAVRPASVWASGSVSLRALLSRIRPSSLGSTFLPAYAVAFGGWHWTAVLFGRCLGVLCALYWCVPSARPAGRAVSFAFMLGHAYLSYATPLYFPWYVPNCTILGVFVLAHVAQQGLDHARQAKDKWPESSGRLLAGVRTFVAVLLASACALFLCAAWQLRIQQREIEEGTRKQIGLWLRQHAASPADSVFLEPLGYIGFFSQLKMLDTPGLCAPEVVAAEKHFNTKSFGVIIAELRPDWLVLRPREVDQVRQAKPQLLEQAYTEAKRFDASDRISAYRWLPGRGYLRWDETFIVFKRNKDTRDAKAL